MLGLGTSRTAKQPPKKEGDDSFRLTVVRSGTHLAIELCDADSGDVKAAIVLSEHNLWALFYALGVFIGVPFSKTTSKRFRPGWVSVSK